MNLLDWHHSGFLSHFLLCVELTTCDISSLFFSLAKQAEKMNLAQRGSARFFNLVVPSLSSAVPQIPTSQKLALGDRQLALEIRWSASQKWKQDTVVCLDGGGTQASAGARYQKHCCSLQSHFWM